MMRGEMSKLILKSYREETKGSFGEGVYMSEKELLKDIGELIFYIQQITGDNYESCAVYDICKKYEEQED